MRAGGDLLVPRPYRVATSSNEAADVTTLGLEPVGDAVAPFGPGQFHMLTAFGVGEVPISVSGIPGLDGPVEHTVRDVGPVSHALASAKIGSVVGVRGPFGTGWGIADLRDRDVVIVAGGIGLAPLRGAIFSLIDQGLSGRRLTLLLGSRLPSQVLFKPDLKTWSDAGVDVRVTVDGAEPGWHGPVGVVTDLVMRTEIRAGRTVSLVCGPEIMIRFVARALSDLGLAPADIRVSLERNMQCGMGWCGHCQLGPLLLCRDGPVVEYGGRLAGLLGTRER